MVEATSEKWSDFYFLCGSSAAGLTGLMFIAVTFGSDLFKKSASLERVHVFFSSISYHFINVFILCAIAAAPDTTDQVLAIGVFLVGLVRLSKLPRAFKIVHAAMSEGQGVDYEDWIQILILPSIIYLSFVVNGVAFYQHASFARDQFAATVILQLITAVWAAWDMVLWLATRDDVSPQVPGAN